MKWPLPILCLALSSCRFFGIPVVGFDGNGDPTQLMLPKKEYVSRLSIVAGDVYDSALPALESATRTRRNRMHLRLFSVGLGANAEIGIKQYKVGAFPRFRMIFSDGSQTPFSTP